ncbi:MAG: hypothetical protein K6C94_08540 [Candidatus Gastranaerophilales bacterium]|nr:hypothetical protein [Candidatus Gastranaerophilales bacterium]
MKKYLILFVVFFILYGSLAMSAEVKQKNNLKIAFLGDSITWFGWNTPYGYVQKTVKALNDEGFIITPFPEGVGGNVTQEMLNRMDSDILNNKPDIMFFMGGINDIWLENNRVRKYRKNVEKIIDKAQKDNIEVILINLTVISEDIKAPKNKKIAKYNKMLEKIAKEKNVQLIDINTPLWNEINKYDKHGGIVTIPDGVHLNEKGNDILSKKVVSDFLETHKP